MRKPADWEFIPVQFVTPVPCNYWRHARDERDPLATYGLLQLTLQNERGDVRPLCLDCARMAVERNESVEAWLAGCRGILALAADAEAEVDAILASMVGTVGEVDR